MIFAYLLQSHCFSLGKKKDMYWINGVPMVEVKYLGIRLLP